MRPISRLLITAARRFGRFAVLLLVLPAVALFCFWLWLIDYNPILFVVVGLVALPTAMLAVALLIGTLFAGLRRSTAKGVTRQEAPGLWLLWDRIAGPQRSTRTVLILSDDLNASVAEERTIFGLLGRRVFLTVGLPLLAVTDEEAIGAILAHEDAHVRNKDTNGGLNLVEFEKSFDAVFDYAPPGSSISGSLLYAALGGMSEAFEHENIRLSRQAEIAADRHASASSHAAEAARALLLVAAAGVLFKQQVYEPLDKELKGAMRAPRPPLDRLLEKADILSSADRLQEYAQAGWQLPDDEKSSHPSWSDRLAALGFASLPELRPITRSAISTLVTKSTVSEHIARFNTEWTSRVEDFLER